MTEPIKSVANEPEYKQPTKDTIALKLAQSTNDWEGFINWVEEQLNAANTAGYDQGWQEGYDEGMEEGGE